ncbi:hypothetical protein Tsubulata_044439 [Turnera subulata]|uniref:F-box domain-containing protein n=1 Tax=Turnera subulata TaxID=218843 RepID=A0A9Q0FZY4_9ROSI|nr:hypothetical protein Tsubulata_044439 [Turnera subulata]
MHRSLLEFKMETSTVDNNGTRRQANNGIAQNLPPDILHDIFSMFPLELILRCKEVCKTWYKAIKEYPSFAYLLLKRSSDHPPSYILEDIGPSTKLFFMDAADGKAREIRLDPVEMRPRSSWNGLLLCVAPRPNLHPTMVCNPITKEQIVLPEIDVPAVPENQVGIGFDPSINKYKVARMYPLGKNEEDKHSLCEIITLGENSWRKMGLPFKVLPIKTGRAIFWEGALHWICSGKEERRKIDVIKEVCILRFDISKEVFDLVPTPFSIITTTSTHLSYKFQLLDLAGSLTLVDLQEAEKFSLCQYKRSEAGGIHQERCFSFDLKPLGKRLQFYSLFGAVDPDKLLLKVSIIEENEGVLPDKIVVYSPEKERFSYLEMRGTPKSFLPTSFRPSLVSIQATL